MSSPASSDLSVARQLAEDLVEYLREHPEVCADVSPVHYPYVRYRDGEWQRASDKRWGRIAGGTFDAELEVVQMFTAHPVTLTPCAEAALRGGDHLPIWARADRQDVFTSLDRCSWCGYSERNRTLGLYETTDDGLMRLCESCRPTWERDDQIVREVTP